MFLQTSTVRNIMLYILLSLIISCASPYQKPSLELVWPKPPDEPRIKFVDIIVSSLDAGKKAGVAEMLFGEELVERFLKPYGVAVDKEGRIYVTDVGRVMVFDLAKKEFSTLGADPGSGQLRLPIGVAAATDGRLFVADIAADKIYVYRSGRYLTEFGETGEFESPSGLALDERRGLLYVCDSKKHRVSVFSLVDYKLVRRFGQKGEAEGEFNYPTNIAVDADGNSYVVDTANFRVQAFNVGGKFLRTFGKSGDMPGALGRPKGIALDSDGHVYVADAAFSNIQIFDREGALLLYFGSHGLGPGAFQLLAGMTIDSEDRIYVVDQVPGSFQIFQYLGEKYKRNRPQ